MSVYSDRGKSWRYELSLNGTRYTKSGFKTKKAAQEAKAKKWEELTRPKLKSWDMVGIIQTDMEFSELLNRRLDHVKVYCSERHYTDHVYHARRWIKEWENLL